MNIVGKSFVFTGFLGKITRDQAIELVRTHGGLTQNAVTKKTDYLVVGFQQENLFKPDRLSIKRQVAEKLITEGETIKLISPTDFFKFFDSG